MRKKTLRLAVLTLGLVVELALGSAVGLGFGTSLVQAKSVNEAFVAGPIAFQELPKEGQETYRLIREGGPFRYDKDGVDVIVELVSTNVALAVMEVAEQKNKITLVSGAASLPITNEKCTANNVHWTYDTYALSNGTAKAVVKQGKKNWYFLTADYAFGAALEKDSTNVVTANGGKVLGTSKHPFPNSDFSSYLLKAQASGADVVALANAGQDITQLLGRQNARAALITADR